MKKRILAILLAGILTASMASCLSRKGSRDETGDGVGGTEDIQQPPASTEEIPQTTPITWETADDYIYTTRATVVLRSEPVITGGGINVTGATKLHRIQKSVGWSQVEYQDATYYIQSFDFTTVDIVGDGFVACSPEETMYVKEKNGLRIRKYAAVDSDVPISDVIGTYKFNDPVTIVAKGDTWCRVKITNTDGSTSFGFVNQKYLMATPWVQIDYNLYFDACEPTTMYVTETCNLRSEPDTENKDNVLFSVKVEAGAALPSVQVTGKGKGDYVDWYRVTYSYQETPGDPKKDVKGYMHKSLLTETLPDKSLDGFLASYPTFTKSEESTMYVVTTVGSLSARKTPVFEGTDNVATYLMPKTAVKVVASGTADNVFCYVIEYEDGVFYFVSAKYITPNESGEPTPASLDALLAQYKDFTACTATDLYATAIVNCYFTPEAGTDLIKNTLGVGTKISLVAKSNSDWCIIYAAEVDLYYFVAYSLFSETPVPQA